MTAGGLLIHKPSSTPAAPEQAVIRGVAEILEMAGGTPAQVVEVLHGTTVGSNAILERQGAACGLLTTRGFRDVLEIGRLRTPELYDLAWDKPEPLVPRRHRLEVEERIGGQGEVVQALEPASVVAAAERLLAAGHREPRDLLHQQLAQPRPRAAGGGAAARSGFPASTSARPARSCRRSRSTSAPARSWSTLICARCCGAISSAWPTASPRSASARRLLVVTSSGGMAGVRDRDREARLLRRLGPGRGRHGRSRARREPRREAT